jgi:hypothetical protein
VTAAASPGAVRERVERRLAERREASEGLYSPDGVARLARLCHRMAERFARDGRLVAVGATAAGRSDARHVAVEFVHPVIVGKRALPAIGLTGETGPVVRELDLIAEPTTSSSPSASRPTAPSSDRPWPSRASGAA